MAVIPIVWAFAKARIELARHDERGEITEKVIIIAVFAALALTYAATAATYLRANAAAESRLGAPAD